MRIDKLVVFIGSIFLISFASCSEKKKEVSDDKGLGKYVYVDDMLVHHSTPNCIKLRFGNDDKGHKIYAKHPIDTTFFVIDEQSYFRVCSECVDDRIYERLLSISNRNKQ